MGSGYGFAGSVGFGKESSGGTPVAADKFIEALTEGLTRNDDRFDSVNINNSYNEPRDHAGVQRIGGPIVADRDWETNRTGKTET